MSFDEELKTPCYVIDTAKVLDKYNCLKSEIDNRGRKDVIAYSVKANYSAGIIESLKKLGSSFEVCSEFEYKMMLRLGVAAENIIVNGCTSVENILKWGNSSLVILDSFEQLQFWHSSKCLAKIGIRINLDYFTKDERFTNRHSRFGVDVQNKEVQKILNEENVRKQIVCIQCHLSGNNREPSIYRDIIKEINKVIEHYELCNIEYVDVGGGFKVGYGKWEFSDYIEAITNKCNQLGLNAKIIYEPGNSIVNNAVCYYTKVVAEKEINGRYIKIVDGSSLQLPRINLQKLSYEINRKSNGICMNQLVVGSTCKESDIILKLENEPELNIGDIVVFKNVGAYSVNEVNTLILGNPEIITKGTNDEILIGNHRFEKICEYRDCYRQGQNNDYSIINKGWPSKQKGLYALINDKGDIIYVGVAFDRVISRRVKQHFRPTDSGGLRFSLISKNLPLEELNNSTLYGCPLKISKQDIQFEEAYLIGCHRPKYNFLQLIDKLTHREK